ncbi:MAG: hypothetical protein CBC48_13110 [bacterium TMED88]|nr:hypothetical protein [Deltaproteobacteria bacterium]OUV28522.1 MAG: hypothetical protein CBC48_13110 [bacterium TMED88]
MPEGGGRRQTADPIEAPRHAVDYGETCRWAALSQNFGRGSGLGGASPQIKSSWGAQAGSLSRRARSDPFGP